MYAFAAPLKILINSCREQFSLLSETDIFNPSADGAEILKIRSFSSVVKTIKFKAENVRRGARYPIEVSLGCRASRLTSIDITRAIQHAIHFDFTRAWHYNKLVVLVLPIFILLWLNEIKKSLKKIKMI